MKIGIVSVSDRCYAGEREDQSGPAIAECVQELSDAAEYRLVPDEKALISAALIELADAARCDVIFTTGGTGLAPRDVTPEATKAVIEKEAPGVSEAIRAKSLAITNRAMLSRAICMQRGRVLVVNLPGSKKAAQENWEGVYEQFDHAVSMMAGEGHA